jgi:hypothetical protein
MLRESKEQGKPLARAGKLLEPEPRETPRTARKQEKPGRCNAQLTPVQPASRTIADFAKLLGG